jgi:RNA-directed DNA polymerase
MRNQTPPNEDVVKRLSLYSTRELEHVLGVGREELRSLAEHAGSWYSPFITVRPPRPFQKRGSASKPRKIDQPIGCLKEVQRLIYRRILKPLTLPGHLCGGVSGRSLLDNVTPHLGASVLVTIDIRSFFPSVTAFHVFWVWRNLLDCSPEISELLTKLTTFERHLPQGAPTSTVLANLVLYSVDEQIRAACQRQGVAYSAWVDDLAFSGDKARDVVNTAVATLMRAGFAVPHRKTCIMGKGARKLVTGLLVGRYPGVVRERIDRIRSGIYKLRAGQIVPEGVGIYLRSLSGNVAQVSAIDPQNGARLRRELDSAIRALEPGRSR